METTPLKRAVIKEELVAVTGDGIKALILNQFLYWSKIKHFSDKFIDEELDKLKKESSNSLEAEQYENTQKNLSKGWIYKKSSEMADEIMLGVGEKTISRHVEELVKKGFLLRRHNPFIKYDRTYQYRVNFSFLKNELNELGYSLDGYRTKKAAEPAKTLKSQNDVSNMTNEYISKSQNDFCKSQNDVCKSQNVGAIPEITTEITTDKNSNSPYIPQNNDEGKIESEPELEYKKIVKDASELIDLHRGTTFKEAPQYEAARYVLGLLDQGYKYGQFMDVVKYALSTWNKSSKDSISPQLLFKPDKFGHYLDVCNEIKSQNIRIKNKFTKQLQNKTKTDLVKEEEQALAKATSQEEYIEIWKKFHKDELDQC